MSAPSLLLVAGLDPSGGAGILADTRVAERRGCRPVGVVTGLTDQDTTGVRAPNVAPADVIEAQLRALLADVELAAVKVGMLGSERIAGVVASALDATRAPVVWDPVLLPTRGRVTLYEGSAVRAAQLLAPHVAVITPNLHEAGALVGFDVATRADMRRAASALRAAGFAAALVTGGHLDGDDAVDVLAHPGGVVELAGPRLATDGPVHGTGCALSTALACELASGATLEEAARTAKAFVADLLTAPIRPGRGLAAIL